MCGVAGVWKLPEPPSLQTRPLDDMPETKVERPAIAFGKDEWKKYLAVEAGVEPPLPENIDTILNGLCPIWKEKKVRDTHILVLIPEKINENPFTLNILERTVGTIPIRSLPGFGNVWTSHKELEEICGADRQGRKTKYKNFFSSIRNLYGDIPNRRPRWILMTMENLPSSRGGSYNLGIGKISNYKGYKVPGVLDAATAILVEYIRSGERLYPAKPPAYTYCQELYGNDHLIVGCFAEDGLEICTDPNSIGSGRFTGVAGIRHLSDNPKDEEDQETKTVERKPSKKERKEIRQREAEEKSREMVEKKEKIIRFGFGKAEWLKYFGVNVGIEPPIPQNILDVFYNDVCPIWGKDGKTVWETHVLVLVPEKVDGTSLTFNLFEKLSGNTKQGTPLKYDAGYDFTQAYGDVPFPSSHWVLMTRKFLPDVYCKGYEKCAVAVKEFHGKYEIPKVIDAVVAISSEYIRSGIKLYPTNSESVCTYCQEAVKSSHFLVGDFSQKGLGISTEDYHSKFIKVAGVLKSDQTTSSGDDNATKTPQPIMFGGPGVHIGPVSGKINKWDDSFY
jgi:hypothetical protein